MSDHDFIYQAIEHAKIGQGHTFPNPVVGCVLVRQDTGEVVGRGFHPRAGFPHAEVFALLEAAGQVPDGVAAAKAVVEQSPKTMVSKIEELLETYAADDGPEQLFGNCLAEGGPVTAYVTLEPCCHHGRTPPCAASLAVAKASRVVVGFRDPDPRVDGGGVQLLENIGVQVDLVQGKAGEACHDIASNFVKRITPNEMRDDYDWVTGSMRMALRSRCNRMKREKSITEFAWKGGENILVNDDMEQAIRELQLPAEWMEHVDDALWRDEIVVVRLMSAVEKEKGVELLGNKVADALKAHVAQTLGHTVLLYRPADPPVLDLDEMVLSYKKVDEEKQTKEE